jgi:hypothetical protein
MGFLSQQASATVNGTGAQSGGYLSASKLTDGGQMRFAIVSESPLEYWTVWGELDGQKKPFRFLDIPSPSDIEIELGDFRQREKLDGSGLEQPKFAISLFVFDYQSESIKVLELTQKGLIKELDQCSQEEDYQDLNEWDFTISRTGLQLNTEYKLRPAPRKKGYDDKIAEAWGDAQKDGYDLTRLIGGGNPFSAA